MGISRAGTVNIGDLTVPRLGYGAMRLPGPGVWGPPADRDTALSVVRQAVEQGVRVIDTAWYYGLDVANEIIAAALRPYPDDLVLVTKLGAMRADDARWHPALDRAALRAGNDRDRKVLGLDTVPVTHLRWLDGSGVTFDEALDTMLEMREEGRIARIGLSNVSTAQLDAALRRTPIATVSNHYGPTARADDPTVDRCTAEGIAYLPFFPLAAGRADDDAALAEVAARYGATPAQVSIAWLLRRSPVMLPIPGTSSPAHLAENIAAADLDLDDDAMDRLSR